MQNIVRDDWVKTVEEQGPRSDIKISEVLLDLKEEMLYDNYEDEIEYEIEFEYEDHRFIRKFESEPRKTKKYEMHSPELKRDCVDLARQTDVKTAAKAFNVQLKSLKRWLAVGPERKKGGGRKIRDPEMERRLYEWYHDYHHVKKYPVTSRMIKDKALEFTSLQDFNASKGWLEKIKKKYNLQISRSSAFK